MTSPSSRRARGVRTARDKALRARGLTTTRYIDEDLLAEAAFIAQRIDEEGITNKALIRALLLDIFPCIDFDSVLPRTGSCLLRLVFGLFRLFLPELVFVLSRFLHLALVLGLFLLFARLQEKVKRGQATATKYKKAKHAIFQLRKDNKSLRKLNGTLRKGNERMHGTMAKLQNRIASLEKKRSKTVLFDSETMTVSVGVNASSPMSRDSPANGADILFTPMTQRDALSPLDLNTPLPVNASTSRAAAREHMASL